MKPHGAIGRRDQRTAPRRPKIAGAIAGGPPQDPDKRGRDWRPGGQHKDPRDRFKVPRDVKRARYKDKLRRDRDASQAAPEEEGRRVIAHIVLLQPRAGSHRGASGGRRSTTLSRAAANVPEIRRFRLGRRVKHGLPGYEQVMPQDFEFALIVEVDDVAGARRGTCRRRPTPRSATSSTAPTSAALAYDYDAADAEASGLRSPTLERTPR